MKPITPKEAQAKKIGDIPPFVIQAFNELIVEHLHNNVATFSLATVKERIRKLDKDDFCALVGFQSRWLDIEPLFHQYGWKVKFDKPAYNETYQPSFTFEIFP